MSQYQPFVIANLPSKDEALSALLKQIKSVERRIFPASEAFAFDSELRKRNTHLLAAYSTSPNAEASTGYTPRKPSKHDSTSAHTTGLPNVRLLGYGVYLRTKSLTRIHKLCVVESERRRGTGRAIMERMIAEIAKNGASEVDLWVDEARLPARRLYQSMGFEEKERVPSYYGDGRTGIRMVKILK